MLIATKAFKYAGLSLKPGDQVTSPEAGEPDGDLARRLLDHRFARWADPDTAPPTPQTAAARGRRPRATATT